MIPIHDSLIDFTRDAPVSGTLDVRWIHGSPSKRRDTDPKIQVHRYDAHTFILRQSKTVSFEAPFLFLLFGNERALLLDTGATADPELFPLRETVDALLAQWLDQHPRPGYELVVAHTHGHGDHVAGGRSVRRPPGDPGGGQGRRQRPGILRPPPEAHCPPHPERATRHVRLRRVGG